MATAPVNPNETAPRYTTVALVKERLAIPPADVSRDTEITSAIVAAEYAIDVFLGRALPDVAPDPVITLVPAAVAEAALQTSIAMWKEADSPTGTMGSDVFMGSVSSEPIRMMIQRNAALIGFRVSFGVA